MYRRSDHILLEEFDVESPLGSRREAEIWKNGDAYFVREDKHALEDILRKKEVWVKQVFNDDGDIAWAGVKRETC